MIRNNRQAAVTRRKYAELIEAAGRASAGQRSGLLELTKDLARQLDEYEGIRDGHTNAFVIDDVDDLGDALIKARLARGWTHRQLAGVLGVSEQMVQRDESRSYEHAGLARVAEVADALGYQLSGGLVPTHIPRSQWRDGSTATQVGAANWNAVTYEFWLTPPWHYVMPSARAQIFYSTPGEPRSGGVYSYYWPPYATFQRHIQAPNSSTDVLLSNLWDRPAIGGMHVSADADNNTTGIPLETTGTLS
jgi:transcriptional regulator with XRE-family HTH domain